MTRGAAQFATCHMPNMASPFMMKYDQIKNNDTQNILKRIRDREDTRIGNKAPYRPIFSMHKDQLLPL